MARFAASDETGSRLNLSEWGFSGRGGEGIANAAGMATMNDAFRSIRSKSPPYSEISGAAMAAQHAKEMSAEKANIDATIGAAGAAGQIQSTEIQAKYAKEAAAEKAKSATGAAVVGGVLGVAKSLIPGGGLFG